MVICLFIESETTKANKLKYMKHTVALCEKAYIRGESYYIIINHTHSYKLAYRDYIFMNELWEHKERLVPISEGEETRIYWKH